LYLLIQPQKNDRSCVIAREGRRKGGREGGREGRKDFGSLLLFRTYQSTGGGAQARRDCHWRDDPQGKQEEGREEGREGDRKSVAISPLFANILLLFLASVSSLLSP